MKTAIDWAVDTLANEKLHLKVAGRTPEGFLIIEAQSGYTFYVAVLGIRNTIQKAHVEHLFASSNKPQLIINVTPKTIWTGAAIDLIHSAGASFGTLNDIACAARTEDAGSLRNKNIGFFINAIKQHHNVINVSYLYNTVFKVERKRGSCLSVAIIDAYNMSAEDVRNAKSKFENFDIIVKDTSYGSITTQAKDAAESMGAQALTFRDLMKQLAR